MKIFEKFIQYVLFRFLRNHDRSHVRRLSSQFGNYYFQKSFAPCAYDYFDSDLIILIGKYLFIFVGMTTRHGYQLLTDLDQSGFICL